MSEETKEPESSKPEEQLTDPRTPVRLAYGGAAFVSALIRENLIDDLYLFVNPVALGSGLAIFTGRTGGALR